MIKEALTDLDLFNYYALDFLELGGNFSPKQCEIDRMESLLKQFFKFHVKITLRQLSFGAEDCSRGIAKFFIRNLKDIK